MRHPIPFLTVSVLAFLAGLSLGAESSVPQPRYQLTAGPYHISDPSSHGGTTHSGLFRLDTVTGEIDEVYEVVENGRLTTTTRVFLK